MALPTFAKILTCSRAGRSIVLPRFFAYFFIMEKVRDAKGRWMYKKNFAYVNLGFVVVVNNQIFI